MKKRHILPLLFLLLTACTLPLEYTGQKYPPTKRVDVYHQGQQIKRPYKVMGKMASHRYSMDIVLSRFNDFAKKNGADAIIILPGDGSKPERTNAELIKYTN
jgi:hypothetical protein